MIYFQLFDYFYVTGYQKNNKTHFNKRKKMQNVLKRFADNEESQNKRQRFGRQTFGNLSIVKNNMLQLKCSSGFSKTATQNAAADAIRELEEIKTTIITNNMIKPLSETSAMIMRMQKAGRHTEQERHTTELIKMLYLVMNQERNLNAKLCLLHDQFNQMVRKITIYQKTFRASLFALLKASLMMQTSLFTKDQAEKETDDIGSDDDTDLFPEEMLMFMDPEKSKSFFENRLAAVKKDIEFESYTKADFEFVRRANVSKLTAETTTQGIRLYRDCLRHLKAKLEACSNMISKFTDACESHEMFVDSINQQI